MINVKDSISFNFISRQGIFISIIYSRVERGICMTAIVRASFVEYVLLIFRCCGKKFSKQKVLNKFHEMKK